LWLRTPLRRDALGTTLRDKVCQWLAAGLWFSPGTLVSSTNPSPRVIGVGLWTIYRVHHGLVEETRVPGENHKPAASHWQTLSRNVVPSASRLSGVRSHNVSQYNKPFHFEISFFMNYITFYTHVKKIKQKTGKVVGRDRMVVAFTTTHAISAYYH
jgi:hypothetical protein